jgi:REP element-mobilizing transposase RayT
MLRGARLDSPGTLHHVIIRGIEKREIVADDKDRGIFVSGMGSVALKTGTNIYAWALMTNHAHILLKSDHPRLSAFMRMFLAGFLFGDGSAIWSLGICSVSDYQNSFCCCGSK